jgi:hypothetical protein
LVTLVILEEIVLLPYWVVFFRELFALLWGRSLSFLGIMPLLLGFSLLLEESLLFDDDVQFVKEDVLAREGLLVDVVQGLFLSGAGGTE